MENRYYIYIHEKDSIPFYVGKGCDDRHKDQCFSARSKDWHEVAKDGFSSSIMASGTKEEMLELEAKIIKRLCGLGFNLVNKYHNPNYVNPLINTPRSDEVKRQMSESSKGKPQSEAHTLTLTLAQLTNGKSKGYTKSGNKYHAQIRIDGKYKFLGTYDTPEEAHQVFLKANAEKIATIQARLQELQERKVA